MALFKKKIKDTEKTASTEPKKSEAVAAPIEAGRISARPKKAVVKSSKKSEAKVSTVDSYKILLRPVISEKATHIAPLNKYTFEVSTGANKVEIKKAIKETYGVMPIRVNIMTKAGKYVRFGKNVGQTKATKKAVVTLKKGDNIRLYEGT
jgi:large subunit ribosomal protein L23